MPHNSYLLISIVTIACMTGCTQTSYQDYPEHWSPIDQTVSDSCIQLAGVYPAVSMDDAMQCRQIQHRNWSHWIRDFYDSCFFLPDAMMPGDDYLPPTNSVTDQIIVEQDADSITINYVDKVGNYMRLPLQRGEDYSCEGNAIRLITDESDRAESDDSDQLRAHDSRSFYRTHDGSLILEEYGSHARTIMLPPFLVNMRTRVWARWPVLPETVSDDLVALKSQFLQPAVEAVERGDMDAAYRLLEDYLGSEDKGFRDLSLEFLREHPQWEPAAFGTFSIKSLQETLAVHGERAKAIEHARLQIYKTVATEAEYRQARENFEKVFPD